MRSDWEYMILIDNLIDVVWSALGIISFLLFLIFYKKMKPDPFWGKSHPAEAWFICQIAFAGPRVAALILELIRGNNTHIPWLFMSIIILIVTGIVMMILGRGAKKATWDQHLTKDIDEKMENWKAKRSSN